MKDSEQHLELRVGIFSSFQIKGQSLLPGFLGTSLAWEVKVSTFCSPSPEDMEVFQLSLSGLAFSLRPSTCPFSCPLCCQVVTFLRQAVVASTQVPSSPLAS